MSRLYDFIYHVRWCTYIKHDRLHNFSRRLSRRMQREILFYRGMPDRGSVKHLERGAFLCVETGRYFLEWYRNMNL